jgi:hypothetical protein
MLYSNYIKFLSTYKTKSPMLSIRMTEVSLKAKSASISDLLMNYEHFDGLITQVFGIFEH